MSPPPRTRGQWAFLINCSAPWSLRDGAQACLRAALIVLAVVVAAVGLVAPAATSPLAAEARNGVESDNSEPVIDVESTLTPPVESQFTQHTPGCVGNDQFTSGAAVLHRYDASTSSRIVASVPADTKSVFPLVTTGEAGWTWVAVEAAGTSTTSSLLTYTPSSGGQRIYRSVEPDELADLMGSGQYRNIPGIGDGKYFFPTRQQADAFAEMMTKRGMGGPYCTTTGCIPADVLRQVERISPAGEGAAYYIPDSLLPYIDDIVIHGG